MRMSITREGSLAHAAAGLTFGVPGYYRCEVTDVGEDAKDPTKCRIEYTVTHGEYAGAKLSQRLDDPATSDHPDMAEKKLKIVAGRLGLWDGETLPLDVDLGELVGKECVIHWEQRGYTDKRTGEAKTAYDVAFAGVYPATGHADIPPDVAAELGVPVVEKEKKGGAKGKPAAATPAAAGAAPPKKPAGKPAPAAPAKGRRDMSAF